MKFRHAFTGRIYELIDDGHVRVTDPDSGAEGIFSADGDWVSGELRDADFHMVRHVGGAQAAGGGLFSSSRG